MLEEIRHPHGRMELPSVIRGPFAAALAAGGAPQQAAGLIDHAAALVTCRRGGRTRAVRGAKPWTASPSPSCTHGGMRGHLETSTGDAVAAAGLSLGTASSPDPTCALCSSSYTAKLKMPFAAF